MADSAQLKRTIEDFAQTLRSQPNPGKTPKTAKVRVRRDTVCDVEVDGHRLVVDVPAALGGESLGPTPGALLRGALGSCLAISFVSWAARLGVPLDDVEVSIEGDWDPRGALGVSGDVPAGYQAFRYTATVRSSASPEKIRKVIKMGDRHSTILQTIKQAIPVHGDLRIA